MATSGLDRAGRRLDPDELAYLEEQQAFLLRSLRDLDREHAAGDMSEGDYVALRDDYTKRAADVARAIESQRAVFREAVPDPSRTRRVVTVVGIVAVAALAGLLLARSAGFRTSRDTATGDIRAGTRALLLEAGELAAAGRVDEAIATYDEVLELQPSNAEALAYKGWYLYLGGSLADAEPLLADAVAADPDLPDARVFRAVVFSDLERFDDAAAELERFDAGDPPPEIVRLVESSLLRERVLAGRLVQTGEVAAVLAESVAQPGRTARAGRLLLAQGEPELAVQVFEAVLAAAPDDVDALLGRGQLLVATGQLVDEGMADLDRALELAPGDPEVRLLRAESLATIGDVDAAIVELDAFDRLPSPSQDLVARADALRASLGA